MGMVHAEITLTNPLDKGFAREGYIKPEAIRTFTVKAIVDTGAMSLVITEELRKKLGLGIVGQKTAKTADGRRVLCKVTEGVRFSWKNRTWVLSAVVIPGAEDVLLGAIPLEALDVMVNPATQELVGIHGDDAEYMALKAAS